MAIAHTSFKMMSAVTLSVDLIVVSSLLPAAMSSFIPWLGFVSL